MVSDQSNISTSKSLYWPSEFTDVVNQLKGMNEIGEEISPPLYRYNTGPIVLAASLGLLHARKRDVGSDRQEISVETFKNHRLDSYLMLIPLLAGKDIDMLRPENEDQLLREFEKYAAGGLEYLRGLLYSSADKSGELILQQAILEVLGETTAMSQDDIPPDIFAS